MIIKNKTSFTTHPSTDREKKNLLFFNLIKRKKSISRTEISKLTDITVVTVSNYINSYLKKGMVLERGYEISSGGRRPELVEINKEWGYVAGVDIAEDNIKAVIMNTGSEILAQTRSPGREKENVASSVNDILEETLKSAKIDKTRLKKIGIAVSKDSSGITEEIIKEKDRIEDAVKIPVLVSENALSGACGEKNLNPELKETSDVLYVYGDLGECIFIKGQEFYDSGDGKDEYAYLRKWGEGLSITKEAKRIIAQGVGTKIVDIAKGNTENITVDIAIKAAVQNDETAIDLIKTSGMNLGVRIAYLINSLGPECVVIGGGIEKAGDIFLNPLALSIKKFVKSKISEKIKVIPAVLGEEAGAKGASSLALREVFIEA